MFQFDRKRFGYELRVFRDSRSYDELARLTGIDPVTLARLENGVRVNNGDVIKDLCHYMGREVNDLPRPKVTMPRISHALSRSQWASLIRLYRYRKNAYIRESAVGDSRVVHNLARLGLLDPVNMKFRRLPYVRITDAGVRFYESHENEYRERYPELYQTSELSSDEATV